MTLKKVDGGIINAGDERRVNYPILSGTSNVTFIDHSYHTLWRAVWTPDTNLIHSDGVTLSHAWSGDVLLRGHKDFDAIFADEAMERCKPFLIIVHGKGEVVRCIGIRLLGRRVEGR